MNKYAWIFFLIPFSYAPFEVPSYEVLHFIPWEAGSCRNDFCHQTFLLSVFTGRVDRAKTKPNTRENQ